MDAVSDRNDVTRQELQYTMIRIMHESGLIHDVEAIDLFKDASNEIVEAFDVDFSNLGYATQDYNRTDPIFVVENDDYSEKEEALLDKLSIWRKDAHRLEISICISIAKYKTSLPQLAFELIRSEQEVLKYYHDGLKRWVEMFFRGKQK